MGLTELVLLAGVVVWLAGDVFLVSTKRKSLSRWFWDQAALRPFVIFLLGYVMGHLTWPGEDCLRHLQGLP